MGSQPSKSETDTCLPESDNQEMGLKCVLEMLEHTPTKNVQARSNSKNIESKRMITKTKSNQPLYRKETTYAE